MMIQAFISMLHTKHMFHKPTRKKMYHIMILIASAVTTPFGIMFYLFLTKTFVKKWKTL